jgi:hypothetical protein
MKKSFSTLALSVGLVGALAPAALAQQGDPDNQFVRNRFTAVQDRQQVEFDPESVRVGSFLVASSLAGTARYNDNIFVQPGNTTGDTITLRRVGNVYTALKNGNPIGAGLTWTDSGNLLARDANHRLVGCGGATGVVGSHTMAAKEAPGLGSGGGAYPTAG